MTAHAQLCTFTVDDLLFGIEVIQVQEVILYQQMTRVPLAPHMVHGLINLRGQIVTAIDLRACLALPGRPSDVLPMNVVVRGAEGSVSLLVDTIGDVIEVSSDTFEAPPPTMDPAHRDVVDAVCKLPGQLLLILDPERAVALASASTGRSRVRGLMH